MDAILECVIVGLDESGLSWGGVYKNSLSGFESGCDARLRRCIIFLIFNWVPAGSNIKTDGLEFYIPGMISKD